MAVNPDVVDTPPLSGLHTMCITHVGVHGALTDNAVESGLLWADA